MTDRAALRQRYTRHPEWWKLASGPNQLGDAEVLAVLDDLEQAERRIAMLLAEAERLRPILDAALLLALTPASHPDFDERKADGWALAFEEAVRRQKAQGE